MQLDDIKNILTFTAFRPDADDPDLVWSKRFIGRRSLLLNISRAHASWRGIDRKGRLQESGSQEGELGDVAVSRADEWRSLTEGGWCAGSVNQRFIISLENNLPRRENGSEVVRTNPKAVLGAKYDRSKRYAIFHHPYTASTLLLACEDAMVKLVEDTFRGNGLKAGRICCGLFAMMEDALRRIYTQNLPEARGNFLLVAMCESSIAALVQLDGAWKDLRCRSGLGTDSVEPMLQIIGPLASKITPGTPVYFVHDGINENLSSQMMEQLASVDAKDLSGPDYLWKLMSEG